MSLLFKENTMNQIAVRVENLSKRYQIGAARTRHATLREQLTSGFKSLFHVNGRRAAVRVDNTFWALKDVSFDVREGEVVGVIGSNGAGKSTLLKILSRITEPTEGRARIQGRVGSLLEVGTGFHPELTGRENIYLNGAILGMKKAEIERKFDEIVDFSGVEKFMDTPVKRYSSGMYVRLAFAVAAHLEPEVLIVDEVLAVGDAAFQKKCLTKMGEVGKHGRTVIFVSHNMGAIRTLCSRIVLLREGRVHLTGEAEAVIPEYLALCDGEQSNEPPLDERLDRSGSGSIRAVSFQARSCDGKGGPPRTGYGAELVVGYRAKDNQAVSNLYVAIIVSDSFGMNVLSCSSGQTRTSFHEVAPTGQIICKIEKLPLIPGTYWINIMLKDSLGQADYITRAAPLNVCDAGDSTIRDFPNPQFGSVVVPHEWEFVSGLDSHPSPLEEQ